MRNFIIEACKLANTYLESGNKLPKKIKVTSEFATYLDSIAPPLVYDENDGVVGVFTGIPVMIDDTIENEYEFVYEEKKK